MSAVNAFDWKTYTDQEHAKRGDPFKEIKRNAVISANVSEGIHKLREKNPLHGTVLGMTTKRLNLRAPDMMPMKGGARLNAGRKLPKIDERRAMSLLDDGLTKKEIAKRFDVPYKSMLTFFKKIGAQDSRGPYDWSGKYKK
ncbi:hypothetical protein UFOVP135_3 [uncultured Caudovirales phage]|uniref:Uncharacterized protein n=1 Tax=uncultured Caudovirales phage TaxID=2100421 RepID=A0A6J5LJT6_9CAUD|nr:hypothetical protein UFOVP135_3 [uncultured Caudovirales phage]